jgi:hypothetical protein
MSLFAGGDAIILRELVENKVWTVRPVRVVQDLSEFIAVYIAPGTRFIQPQYPNSNRVPSHLLSKDWRLVEKVWSGGGALFLGRTDQAYMIIGFRNVQNTGFETWYINLQDPLTRTPLGFDYLDMELDVRVDAGLTGWEWKDMDEFNVLVKKGIIPYKKAVSLRSLGEQVAESIIAGTSIVNDWLDWTPPEDWEIPPLPDNWETTS